MLLLLGFLLLRSLVTFPAENVDAMIKYDLAAYLVRGGEWSALLDNQHTMRWSQTLPQVLVTWLTGFRYEGLYILPLLAFAAGSALLVAATWDYLGAVERLLLAGLLFIEPLALNHTGQLLNPPFGALFVSIAAFCLSRQPRPSAGMVMVAALMLFAAYGSHVTYLAFAAGACVFLLLRQLPLHAVTLGAGLLALLGLETLIFNALSGGELSFGRIQALAQSSHVAAVDDKFPALDSASIAWRWLHLPAFNQVLVAGFLGLTAWQWWQRRRRNAVPLPLFITCLMLCAAAYGLAVSIAVIDLNPVKPLLPIRNMYLEVFMPFAALASVYLVSGLLSGLSNARKLAIAGAGAMVLSALFVLMLQSKGGLRDIMNSRLGAFVWHAEQDLGDYSRRFADGKLVVKGPNVGAMVRLARYQNPVAIKHSRKSRMNISANPENLQPDALCVANLRRRPIERNYHDCKRFVPPPRGKLSWLAPGQVQPARQPGAQSSIMRSGNSG